MNKEEPDQGEGKGEGESVGETLDPHWAVSATANCPANQTHDETRDYGTDQQADSVKPRRMNERMRKNQHAQRAEKESQDSEFHGCQRWIPGAEGVAKEGCKTKAARRPRRNGYPSFEDKLEKDLEKDLEDEAQDFPENFFHASCACLHDSESKTATPEGGR